MLSFFQKIMLLLLLVLPWTVECAFFQSKINLPAEIIIGVAALVLCAMVVQKFRHQPAALTAAFSCKLLIITALWIFWQGVSVVFSTMPVVSVKYFIVELSHWWVFFVGMYFFPNIWERGLPIFIVSMAGVVSFTLTTHYFYDFRPDQSNLAPMPFFPDHTMFSAALCMLVGWLFLLKSSPYWHAGGRIFIILWCLAGIYFSYCRAAWASLVLSGGIVAVLYVLRKWSAWRYHFRVYAIFFLVSMFLGVVVMLNRKLQAAASLSDGNARSLTGQVYSMFNFKTDVSNLERLNRYRCAMRMAARRPVVGFGVGTFPFQYLPFQRAEEMTRISVVEPIRERHPGNYGRGGGAHSQYFQAWAETGGIGLALWLCCIGMTIWHILSAIFSNGVRARATPMLWGLLGSLLTFWIHALANDLLHDGRIAAIFWGSLGWFSHYYENAKK